MNKRVQVLGSKKAVEPQVVNEVAFNQSEKRTNFQMVAVGVCPHDGASLSAFVKTSGVGEKAVCSQCGHTWYINRKIKTCGCLTCKGTKRKSSELVGTGREVQKVDIKNGGPFWVRTRDLSLIRTAL